MDPETPNPAKSTLIGQSRPPLPSRDSNALFGATRAFASPSPVAKPLARTYSGTNGAVAAAAKAGQSKALERSTTVNVFAVQYTPPSNQSPDFTATSTKALLNGFEVASKLQGTMSAREISPSLLAAARAASKSPSLASRTETKPSSMTSRHAVTNDQSSIAATASLVKMFEAKEQGPKAAAQSTGRVGLQRANTVVSPRPLRPSKPVQLSPSLRSDSYGTGNDPPKPLPRAATAVIGTSSGALATARVSIPVFPPRLHVDGSNDGAERKKVAPEVPPPRRSTKPTSTPKSQAIEKQPPLGNSNQSYEAVDRTSALGERAKPSPPSAPLAPTRHLSDRSGTAPSAPIPIPKPTNSRPRPTVVTRVSSSQPSYHSSMTEDSLANAMVAGSLAQSRASSPSKSLQYTPIPPSRHHPHRSDFLRVFHTGSSYHSRSNSPTKNYPLTPTLPIPQVSPPSRSPVPKLQATLRRARSVSHERYASGHTTKHEADLLRRRAGQPKPGFLTKKAPNKHHEASRRRWMDEITGNERKRYEGLWASNRGLLLLSSYPAWNTDTTSDDETGERDGVHGYLVRDIWLRSGLGAAILEEVWTLVCGRGRISRGRPTSRDGEGDKSQKRWLSREEFVVGMWLVDQCLKGRKLPYKVGDTVWESVWRLEGVRIGGRY